MHGGFGPHVPLNNDNYNDNYNDNILQTLAPLGLIYASLFRGQNKNMYLDCRMAAMDMRWWRATAAHFLWRRTAGPTKEIPST
jgi:hypothetical protein